MAYQQKKPPISTIAHKFFNSEFGTMQLKFMNRNSILSIAPILEDMKGKKARRGVDMYDYTNQVGMSLNTEELVQLKYCIDALATGDMKELKFSHTFGESIKNITFGIGQDEESDNLQIYMEELERQNPDDEPLKYVWYEFNPHTGQEIEGLISLEIEVFKQWLDSAIRVNFLEVSHANFVNNLGSPTVDFSKKRDNYNRNSNQRGSYNGGGRDNYHHQ